MRIIGRLLKYIEVNMCHNFSSLHQCNLENGGVIPYLSQLSELSHSDQLYGWQKFGILHSLLMFFDGTKQCNLFTSFIYVSTRVSLSTLLSFCKFWLKGRMGSLSIVGFGWWKYNQNWSLIIIIFSMCQWLHHCFALNIHKSKPKPFP
jgi:hypothetical protein